MLEIQILPLSLIFLWYSVRLLILVSLSFVLKAFFESLIISFLTFILFSSGIPLHSLHFTLQLCIICFPICVYVFWWCFSFWASSHLTDVLEHRTCVVLSFLDFSV